MIAPLIFGYVLLGILASCALFDLAFDPCPGPPGAEPALRFLLAVFWPLALVSGILYLLWLLSRSVAGGFAVLWRHYRGVRLPKMKVEK